MAACSGLWPSRSTTSGWAPNLSSLSTIDTLGQYVESVLAVIYDQYFIQINLFTYKTEFSTPKIDQIFQLPKFSVS
jgi:hypothetical protein